MDYHTFRDSIMNGLGRYILCGNFSRTIRMSRETGLLSVLEIMIKKPFVIPFGQLFKLSVPFRRELLGKGNLGPFLARKFHIQAERPDQSHYLLTTNRRQV